MPWNQLPLLDRIRGLRLVLPPVLALWVVVYQLAFAQPLELAYGHLVHYGVEIAFYSLAGPVVTWLTLRWVERNVQEKERLEAQVRHVAQQKAAMLEEERARIARDLHDGIAQTLYFLALKADMLRSQLQADAAVAAELQGMGQTMRQVIREVRQTIFALRPLNWEPGAFLPALQEFVAGFAEQMGWEATFAIEDHLAIPSTLEPLLFRVVQESLNNVAKHAAASHVDVSLESAAGGWLCLTVRDDGHGYDPTAVGRTGMGLPQMTARLKGIGGALTVVGAPGEGTTVTARLPSRREDDE